MQPPDPQIPHQIPPQLPRLVAFCRDFRAGGAAQPIVWDGGVGTALIARGLDLGRESPEDWLLRRPDEVLAVHSEFAAAGAEVLQTCSFGLVRLFAEPSRERSALGPEAELGALVQQSVRLANQAAQHGAPPEPISSSAAAAPTVVGCLGPTGRTGIDEGRLEAAYGAAAHAFHAAGVAALHLETCLDPGELQLALRGIRRAAPELALMVSLTLSMGQSGPETPLGVPLARMLRELDHHPLPLAMVGINCSQPARRLHAAVAALYGWTAGRLPILVQPQVGDPAPDCRHPARPESPERFARDLLRLRDEGASALGGCCGARGQHIRALHQALASSPEPSAG
ncbi:MAG TPA: homocysteine S-methyltransferase family protein [Pseudomonadota bacterium]|nr:homocysteine S-methyltransferase family protein [Pseudomonadota bacterium]